MDNTRGLSRVILKNPAGHLHFASSWYGGRKIYRDEPWAWQKPYAFVAMHGPTLIGVYNGNPGRARAGHRAGRRLARAWQAGCGRAVALSQRNQLGQRP